MILFYFIICQNNPQVLAK